MTNTLTYGHSSFATQLVHAWQPDKPGFSRALCGIRLADTLIITYARPMRVNASWCEPCFLLTMHAAGGRPTYVMRRSTVDACGHVIPADVIGTDRTYPTLCGQHLTDAVAVVESACPCGNCVEALAALLAQEIPG